MKLTQRAPATRKPNSKIMLSRCLPVFIGDFFMTDGHTEDTTSATVTFVRYKDKIYAVTCRHVHQAALKIQGHTTRINLGNGVINLSNWHHQVLKSSLRDVSPSDGSDIDISICQIPKHLWELIKTKKAKAAINLDTYQEPQWSSIRMCVAAGFPNRLKYPQKHQVAAPMVEVVAHLSSNLNASEDRFTIQSKLREPSKYMLSGISGGPVFAFQSKGRIVPIGIVFEGHPSGESDGDDRPLGFLTENDIMVRGLVLTPEKFAYWLTAI